MIPSGPHLHTGEEERTQKNRNKQKWKNKAETSSSPAQVNSWGEREK